MIMDTSESGSVGHQQQQQQSSAYTLMKRGKRGAAAIIAVECCNVVATAEFERQLRSEGGGDDDDPAALALVRCKLLDDILDILLNPYDAIGEWNNLDWLRWLMAGGKTLDEFSSAVKDYDYGTCCGLVWTANYVAYRCRTCSISPCMSLCGDCFKRGDHTGHDFNMFRSQAGGACDCGDTSVMKPNGFCRKHSTNNLDGTSSVITSGFKQPPADLLSVAERILPRLLLRLVQYLRENSKIADSRSIVSQQTASTSGGIANQQHHFLLTDLDSFLGMLHDLSALGAAMRRVMTVSLTSEKIYKWACEYYSNSSVTENNSNNQQPQQQSIYAIYTDKVHRYYTEAIYQYTSSRGRRRHSDTTAVCSSDSEDDSDEFGQDGMMVDGQKRSGRKSKLNHLTFLQEIVFWTVRYEFPQKIVCFLLNMLPDAAYKESLTEAFVMHYGCVARVLATTRDSDTLSNHIVHISVQLFSNEALATRMVDKLGLLRIMVSSLRRMMNKILIPSTLHDPSRNRHRVVDCSKAVMKEHCYWPLVSDLNNVLSHRPIAVKFMCDDRLLDAWFSYLSMFQGMNVNCQELGHHVEFEPNTYYAAFSAELEASAYPMWALLSHLTSAETWPLTSRVLRACLQRLRKWLTDVGYYSILDNQCQGVELTSSEIYMNTFILAIQKLNDSHQFTFHLPLHRYLAVFLCQAVRAQGARVEDILPFNPEDVTDRDALLLAIATHPVRAQAAFYEIMQGTWVRNGLQIKGQAMTYIQSNFCISMVDADIYLLQLCLSELSDVNMFLALALEKFKAYDWMCVVKYGGLPQIMDSAEYNPSQNMESLLVFLATLVGVRTNLCSDENYDYCQSQLEMVTLLCVSDKTHSQLMELMPERCGGGVNTSSGSNSTSNISNTGNQSSQDSASALRDFEAVLQVVAEYKRPQFEASGNMQQGFYIPLPHVWEELYDPVHVLLRAVHRRDFQSSMDRYAAFMRSIGLLQQNQSPWPPYRLPQKHHSAYQDPRRVLLTKLFHSIVWHCLYRSNLYKDVSEHSLSLLVYLLDQAWICYKPSNTTTNIYQESMDTQQNTDNNIHSKKHIKITSADVNKFIINNDTSNDQSSSFRLFNRWFDSDDLVSNLCTTISHIELPPSYLQNYFSNDDPNLMNGSASTSAALTINLLDYFSSSATTTSSSITVSNNTETSNSFNQQPNIVPSLAAIASSELPIPRSSQSSTVTMRPIFYSLNAAAAATSSTMADSALNHVKQTLQLLRPLQKTVSNKQQLTNDINSTAFGNNFENATNDNELMSDDQDHCFENSDNVSATDIDDDKNQQNAIVPINESIISLLLKLHSHLSGVPDSYQPPSYIDNELDQRSTDHVNDEFQNKTPLCGDGPFYVGRLLDKIAKGSKLCYECIIRTRMVLWPKAVVMRETATREDEERERRERKRRARDKQLQMMNEMAKAQRAFLESARRSGDLDSSDIDLPSQSTGTTTTVTKMECEEPANIVDPSSSFTGNNEITATSLPNEVHVLDEFNSTSTTAKDSIAHNIHQQKSTLTVDCVICNQTVVVQMEQQRLDPVGLVILVQGTNILAHRRHITPPISANNEWNLKKPNEQHQQLHKSSTVSNSTNINYNENTTMEGGEQNYYHCWPTLPPLQPLQSHNQNTTVDDSGQNHKSVVPTVVDDEDMTTYASHCDRRKNLLRQYFNPLTLDSSDLDIGALTTASTPPPISGNVHVQTCGHHLHLRCWNAYLSSLRGAQRFNSDRGEYSCPLCRQLANSLMPLIPPVTSTNQEHQSLTLCERISEITDMISEQESSDKNSTLLGYNSSELSTCDVAASGVDQPVRSPHLLFDNFVMNHDNDGAADLDELIIVENEEVVTPINTVNSLLDAVNKCVHDMICTTLFAAASNQRRQMYLMKWQNVVSIAWTNIQIELMQRNNNLIENFHSPPALLNHDNQHQHTINSIADNSGTNIYYDIVPKRNCIAQMLKVLSVSAQSLMIGNLLEDDRPISPLWYKLIGMEQPRELWHISDPPLLMRDPCCVLIQLVLLLPDLKSDLFDTLVQLTFNMQLFAAALKVATACIQSNQQSKSVSSDSTNKNIQTSSAQMNLNDCATNQSPILSIPHFKSPSLPLFSQAVALAKSIVFLPQDQGNENVVNLSNYTMEVNNIMDHIDVNQDKTPLVTLENNEVNLMLESYGRQCTLPFLRFATLLKYYTLGENIDHIDGHHDFATMPSFKQINLNLNQHIQKSQLLDSQMESSHDNIIDFTQSNNAVDILMKNSSFSTPTHDHQNWSKDDHEFLILAQYLNLLKSDKEPTIYDHQHSEENNVYGCEYKNDTTYGISENIKHLLHQPPSAMELVRWPEWACFISGGKDNVETTISRTWLASFREAMLNNSKSVIIRENVTGVSTSSVSLINPNCSSTIASIIMEARMLLAVDCCKGNGIYNNGILPTINWTGPRLLKLPNLYDDVFQYYHGRSCHRCHGVPRETSVCLLCGTVVCLKENCCKTNNIYEAVQHSMECGGGTGMFLVVTSSSVVVIRGKRACLWGSVYLDAFGEEDRELKRGKPLYLSAERYRLLERQWLAHRFDHTNKKWVWHRDAL